MYCLESRGVESIKQASKGSWAQLRFTFSCACRAPLDRSSPSYILATTASKLLVSRTSRRIRDPLTPNSGPSAPQCPSSWLARSVTDACQATNQSPHHMPLCCSQWVTHLTPPFFLSTRLFRGPHGIMQHIFYRHFSVSCVLLPSYPGIFLIYSIF